MKNFGSLFRPSGYGYGDDKKPVGVEQAGSSEDLKNRIAELQDELWEISRRIADMPGTSHELPICRFEADKYFKWQRDGINLTLQFNPDQLQRNLAAGGLGGGGGSNGEGGVVFAGMARILTSTSTGIVDARGNPVQWTYIGAQMNKSGPAYGNAAWGQILGLPTIRNLCEVGNTGIGVQDNGVDMDGQIFTDNSNLLMQPIGGTLPLYRVQVVDGAIEYWIDRVNAIGGECGSSP